MNLRTYTDQVLILAYKEDTTRLEQYLTTSGMGCTVLRQVHQPHQVDYARIYLGFLNHQEAWKRVVEMGKAAVVVEADFVPVRDFAQLPLPFDPLAADTGVSWLYNCAAQIYNVSPLGHAQGFSSAAVAYIVTPQAAQHLLNFGEQVRRDRGEGFYYNWDSEVDSVLLAQGLRNYIPLRNYGEHGSASPNPEHRRQGFSRTHRADVLAGPLAFTPDYVPTEGWWSTRLYARTKGLGRLMLGRFVRMQVLFTNTTPWRLTRFALGRQACPWL